MLQRLGDAYAGVLTDHHRLLRLVLAAHDGREVDTQGDAFFAVFSSASACVAAAIEVQLAFLSHAWPAGETVRVRMGIHSGEASESAAGLVGLDIHRAARIAAVAHGGQVVLSASTAALLRDRLPDGAFLQDLGSRRRLRDLQSRPGRVSRRLGERGRRPVYGIFQPGQAGDDEARYRLCADRPGHGRQRRRPGPGRPAAWRGRGSPVGSGRDRRSGGSQVARA